MSLNTLYEDLLFLGGYVSDPHLFEKQLPNGDRVKYLLSEEPSAPATKPEQARAA